MSPLPLRLEGFLDALIAISDGAYQEGGLSITYPSRFDRNDLEVIWICGGVERSEGFLGLPHFRTLPDFSIKLYGPQLLRTMSLD
jgi:hypothetical protein